MSYTLTASIFHWAAAVPMIGSIGCVLKAQQAPKEEKGLWMHRHKSLGLLAGMVVFPRMGYRLIARTKYDQVPEVVGSGPVESAIAKWMHYALYAFMTIMPATGIAMGYYGGKGLPFFNTTFKGIELTEENKAQSQSIAKNSFNIHKQVGVYGKYLVPLHVAGAFQHWARGHTIFSRINPFSSSRPPKF